MKTMSVEAVIDTDQKIRHKLDQLEQQVTKDISDNQCQQLDHQFEETYPGYTIIGISCQTVNGSLQITRKPFERNYQIRRKCEDETEVFYYNRNKKQWWKQNPLGKQLLPETTDLDMVLKNSRVECCQLPPYLQKTKEKSL